MIYAILMWILIKLSAPAWCYWFWGISLAVKILLTAVKLVED